MKKEITIIVLLFLVVQVVFCAPFRLHSGQSVTIACDASEEKVVQTALRLFSQDFESVFSAPVLKGFQQANMIVGTVGVSTSVGQTGVDISILNGKKQAFLLEVLPDGRLLIAGSDPHGTASWNSPVLSESLLGSGGRMLHRRRKACLNFHPVIKVFNRLQ